MRYAVQVQYIGKNYAGSQLQAGSDLPTIQGELEKALSTLIYGNSINNNRPVKTIFSGRTDKGVNSVGQVVHFDCDKPIVASKFVYSLNEILPNDISVTNLKEVDPEFHAVIIHEYAPFWYDELPWSVINQRLNDYAIAVNKQLVSR